MPRALLRPSRIRSDRGRNRTRAPRRRSAWLGAENVTRFRAGDDVFAARVGAFAEYVCGAEKNFLPKPAGLTFEQAAAIPVAGCTALQGLRDRGRVQPGQKVLINGAAGGVGTFAVQIAKAFGADVTGVCGTGNVDLVRSLGADHVIDYTKEDLTKRDQRYDVIYDLDNDRSFAHRLPVPKIGAICI